MTFHSWAPRRLWLSGQERIVFGEPHWEHLPEHEVEALLGWDEMQARPPQVPIANDQAQRLAPKPPFAAAHDAERLMTGLSDASMAATFTMANGAAPAPAGHLLLVALRTDHYFVVERQPIPPSVRPIA